MASLNKARVLQEAVESFPGKDMRAQMWLYYNNHRRGQSDPQIAVRAGLLERDLFERARYRAVELSLTRAIYYFLTYVIPEAQRMARFVENICEFRLLCSEAGR